MAEPPSDTIALVRGAQAGDARALEQLFERYYPRVLRLVRLRLGAELRDAVESMDIVQRTFLEAWRDLDRLEPDSESSLIQWLARVAENEIRDEARRRAAGKRGRGRTRALESLRARIESGELSLSAAQSIELPPEFADRREQLQRLDEALLALEPGLRELVLQRNIAGASWAEVTRALGFRTERAARVAHAKALIALAERLAPGQ